MVFTPDMLNKVMNTGFVFSVLAFSLSFSFRRKKTMNGRRLWEMIYSGMQSVHFYMQ